MRLSLGPHRFVSSLLPFRPTTTKSYFNMKSVCLAFVLFGVVATAMAALDKEAAMKHFMKCKEDEKVSDKEVDDMKSAHELNSDGAKRLMRCLFTSGGLMKDDKFDKEGLVKMSEKIHDGEEDKDKKVATAKEIAEVCDGTVGAGGATPEDTAKMIFDCLKEESHKRGISPPGQTA